MKCNRCGHNIGGRTKVVYCDISMYKLYWEDMGDHEMSKAKMLFEKMTHICEDCYKDFVAFWKRGKE